MKNNGTMKIIIIGAVVVMSLVALLWMKNYFNIGFFNRSTQTDLIIVNDSADTISSSYKQDGKEVDNELKGGDGVTGGKGTIRIYTAKRKGWYDIAYPYPRPSGTPMKITLTQIADAAQKKELGDALYTERGMIGDIKVEYEEVREFD